MATEQSDVTKRRPMKRIVLLSLMALVTIAGILLYNNFNRLISEALMRSFNSSIASDVYELKFEKLRVNLFEGSIRVTGVLIQPREKPLKRYPYINSSFRLTTDQLSLMNVQIWTLLKSNTLRLERITIGKPDIQLIISDLKPVFLPFKDSAAVLVPEGKTTKKAIESFALARFEVMDASFHVANSAKEREFRIVNFNISLNNLIINQTPGVDQVAFEKGGLSVGEFVGHLKHGAINHVSFRDFKIGVDSLRLRMTVDTVMFRFDDFTTGLRDLDTQTTDSLFHLTVQAYNLSYKERSIKLVNLSFKPNISDAEMQNRFKFQHTSVSGKAGLVEVSNINFDTLIHHRVLLIDRIVIDKPVVSIFKDNTKPVDKNRIPKYFGQQISAIPMPMLIKQVQVKNVNLVNVERKRDSSYAKVNIGRGTVTVKNITNRSSKPMTLSADAYLDNKVHFSLVLGFNYRKPEFTVDGKLVDFNLPDLNPIIEAYTPAKINRGTADEIAFEGIVYETNASGTMKFLYRDLEVDLNLPKKAKWKSSVIAFAANAILASSNPGSAKLPPRIVQYQVNRDMNKGFVNIILKSVLSGLKETMIMSKENKKAYKESKKKMKSEKAGK